MKKVSMLWAFVVGFGSILWQVLTYYLRFGQINPYAPWTDYVWFFLAGSLGGAILLFFLNRQTTGKAWWAVLVAFLLGTPIAMIFMVGGGLLGFIFTMIVPQIPWLIFTWIGSLVGRFLSRG